MFINQAAEQFKLFTHLQCNMELMRKTVLDCLSSMNKIVIRG